MNVREEGRQEDPCPCSWLVVTAVSVHEQTWKENLLIGESMALETPGA